MKAEDRKGIRLVQRRKYDPSNKERVFEALRREILAARLKVILDEQLGRETSPTVQRLSKMKLPPLVRQNRSIGEAIGKQEEPHRRKYDPTSKKQLFETLRREILAARLKVTLDEQLGRETSPTVQRLSKMKLPPIVQGMILLGNVRGTLLIFLQTHRMGSESVCPGLGPVAARIQAELYPSQRLVLLLLLRRD